jgi:hypothetical protein
MIDIIKIISMVICWLAGIALTILLVLGIICTIIEGIRLGFIEGIISAWAIYGTWIIFCIVVELTSWVFAFLMMVKN